MTSLIQLADFCLGSYSRTLGIVVDGAAQVLHIIDELVPPSRIFPNGSHLFGSCNGILNGSQPVPGIHSAFVLPLARKQPLSLFLECAIALVADSNPLPGTCNAEQIHEEEEIQMEMPTIRSSFITSMPRRPVIIQHS